MGRFGRVGTNGFVLSRTSTRRAGRPGARSQASVPNLQRLHDRAKKWTAVGLLPARPFLQDRRNRRTTQTTESSERKVSTDQTPKRPVAFITGASRGIGRG